MDGVCLAFAAWTLLCHVVVLLGGDLFHLLGAAAAALAAAFFLPRRETTERPPASRPLWALALLCTAVTLFAHRPDSDDAIYMGLAGGVAEFPRRPLLRFDAAYGLPDLPSYFAAYRVDSIEVLYGALSYLLRVPALAVSHLLSAPLWAAMVPLAFARLFGALGERRWLWGAGGVVLFLVLDGGGHGSYGNLAFVRMFQGKCVYLCVFAPLAAAYAVEFMERPSGRAWLLLAAALVGAVGMTSSSLWSGPLLVLLALGSAWRRGRTPALLAGAAAALYPLAIALALRPAVRASGFGDMALAPGMERELLSRTLEYVLGSGAHRWALLAAAVAAPALCFPSAGARLAAAQAAAFLVLFNPWTAAWAALHVTGTTTYFRVFWLLPVPLAVGLLAMRSAEEGGWRRAVAAGFLLAALFPAPSTLSASDGTSLRLPGLKVPAEYPLVRAVNAGVPTGSRVLAPEEVSDWMVTENRHAFPILYKSAPWDSLTAQVGAAEVARRARLQAYLGGGRPERLPPEELRRALADYSPAGVCFLTGLPWAGEVRAELAAAGMSRRLSLYGYEFWTRAVVQS